MELLSFLIFLSFLLAILHFIYERIILPTIQLHFRHRLFALRDEVRNLLMDTSLGGLEKEYGLSIDRFINTLISKLRFIGITIFWGLNRNIKKEEERTDTKKDSLQNRNQSIQNPEILVRLLEIQREVIFKIFVSIALTRYAAFICVPLSFSIALPVTQWSSYTSYFIILTGVCILAVTFKTIQIFFIVFDKGREGLLKIIETIIFRKTTNLPEQQEYSLG